MFVIGNLFIWGLLEVRKDVLRNTVSYYEQCIADNGPQHDLLCRQHHGLSLETAKFERQLYEASDDYSPFRTAILKDTQQLHR